MRAIHYMDAEGEPVCGRAERVRGAIVTPLASAVECKHCLAWLAGCDDDAD